MQSDDFIGLLAAISPGAQVAAQEVRNDWLPEEPPVTTLFAAIGDRLAEDFEETGSDASRRTFGLIEQAMGSDDSGLVTAVATGLIEALVTRALHDEGLWERMAPFLGPRSLRHAKVWMGAAT